MEKKSAVQTKIIGVYSSADHADNVAKQLADRGISRNQIYISRVGEPKEIPHSPAKQESLFEELKSFFHSMFDDFDAEKIQEAYAAALKKTNLVVSADAHDEEQAQKISAFMSDIYSSHRDKTIKKVAEKPAETAASHPLEFVDIFDKN